MINDLWYKNAVVYCLSVATYMDANGDGVGDFAGLMRRLDYLSGLGVTAIWLMPFQASCGPQKFNQRQVGTNVYS
jgi:maltose alpha-D-glucosyltransferase/alpha-amylase